MLGLLFQSVPMILLACSICWEMKAQEKPGGPAGRAGAPRPVRLRPQPGRVGARCGPSTARLAGCSQEGQHLWGPHTALGTAGAQGLQVIILTAARELIFEGKITILKILFLTGPPLGRPVSQRCQSAHNARQGLKGGVGTQSAAQADTGTGACF